MYTKLRWILWNTSNEVCVTTEHCLWIYIFWRIICLGIYVKELNVEWTKSLYFIFTINASLWKVKTKKLYFKNTQWKSNEKDNLFTIIMIYYIYYIYYYIMIYLLINCLYNKNNNFSLTSSKNMFRI